MYHFLSLVLDKAGVDTKILGKAVTEISKLITYMANNNIADTWYVNLSDKETIGIEELVAIRILLTTLHLEGDFNFTDDNFQTIFQMKIYMKFLDEFFR